MLQIITLKFVHCYKFGNVENIKINNTGESVNMELKNADSVLTAENGLYTLKRTFTPNGNFGEDSVLSYDFELNSPKDSRVRNFSGGDFRGNYFFPPRLCGFGM